ncbi:MAG TPA: hypothetical protein VKD72_02625, partial [Gemmataceae bacterium]|nr:hypothetical protein [Gemmataceae bacterium]
VPEPSEANWTAAVEGLRSLNTEARQAVIGFDPGQLDAPLVADPPYSAYTQFVGLTQHDLYHAGQIARSRSRLDYSGCPCAVIGVVLQWVQFPPGNCCSSQ